MEKRRVESDVWQHFTKNDEKSMKCNYCQVVLTHIHATNAKKHLKKCKAEEYHKVEVADKVKQPPAKKPKISENNVVRKDPWSAVVFPADE